MGTITIAHGLPFVSVTIYANRTQLQLDNVLLDTGSAATVFKTTDLEQIGISLEPTDIIHFMTGIGGRETIVEKQIETLALGNLSFGPFTIQMGSLSYGFQLNGIVGLDFLVKVGVVVDFEQMIVRGGKNSNGTN